MKYLLLFLLPLVAFAAKGDPGGKGPPIKNPTNLWSDPKTWGGTVPAPGTAVVIDHGKLVILDVNVSVESLLIHGTLEVARQDVSLTAGWIMHHGGVLRAGTIASPFAHNFTITLTGTDPNAIPGMGGRALAVMDGGRLELIGKAPAVSWTMLQAGATAAAGAPTILLDVAPGWKIGDEIIITSTDFDYAQTEKRRIVGISGNAINLDAPLTHLHYGVITQVDHDRAGVPTTIDERAEVGLLTRNIKIQGAADSEDTRFGGHVMIMGDTSVAQLQGVEFYRMGQFGRLGRYPMHWHDVNDGGSNSWMWHCSTHHSFNRGTTIHKTNNLAIADNVIYDTLGHGFFFEDGKEVGNTLLRNLVALVHRGPIDNSFDPWGQTPHNGAPAAFWISNPNNTFIGNAAAGTAHGGFGFWFALPEITRPGSISDDPAYNPSAQPFGVFRGNRAHSIASPWSIGAPQGKEAWGFFLNEYRGPSEVLVEDFTAFKNGSGSIWHEGLRPFTARRCALAGDIPFFNYGVLKDSLAIGRTANPVMSTEAARDRGINLIGYNREIPEFCLVGYDDVPSADNCVFGQFRGVYHLRFRTGHPYGIADSTFLNNDNYRTAFIANVLEIDPGTANLIMVTWENPEDSFGNGGPGFFTFAKSLTLPGAKNVATGAKGLEATDALGWWSPYPQQ